MRNCTLQPVAPVRPRNRAGLAGLRRHPRAGLSTVVQAAVCAAILSSACAPALDWREVRPVGTTAKLLMPCKPSRQERTVQIEGRTVRLDLHVCSANKQTWGVAVGDVGDPQLMGAALKGFARAASAHVSAATPQSVALSVPGATPHPDSQRLRFVGRGPGGQPLQSEVAVFARGTQVFQLTALGAALPESAAQTFMESVHFAP